MKHWRESLTVRLVVYFLLLSLIPLIAVGYISYSQTQEALKRGVFNHLDTAATLKEEEINRGVAQRERSIQLLAKTPIVRQYAPPLLTLAETDAAFLTAYTALGDYLAEVVAGEPDLQEIFILSDVGGKTLLSTTDQAEGEYHVTDAYFVEGRKGTYIQNVYPSASLGKTAMTIATPLQDENGQVIGVLATHVNLDELGAIMSERGGLGGTGETYLVDQFNVFVSEARFGREGFPRGVHTEGINAALGGQDGTGFYQNYRDVPVAGAYRWIEERELALLAEQEVEEAFSHINQVALVIGVLVVLAVIITVTATIVVARRITRPISQLTETASAIAAGDLTQSAVVERSDEIGILARAFNSMTVQLRGLIGSLEQRVAERTQELEARSAEFEQASRQSQRRATLLQASAEVNRAIAQIRDLDTLLTQVTHLISLYFGFYHAGVFLIDDAGLNAVLRAANSEGGQRMLARGHKLGVGTTGIVGFVTGAGQPRVALDVGADVVYFDNPDLPETRSEMAVPLRIGGQVVGALDVQSIEPAAFGEEDVAVLSTLADQIAIAIENANLLQQTQAALQEAKAAHRRYLRQEWDSFLGRRPVTLLPQTLGGVHDS